LVSGLTTFDYDVLNELPLDWLMGTGANNIFSQMDEIVTGWPSEVFDQLKPELRKNRWQKMPEIWKKRILSALSEEQHVLFEQKINIKTSLNKKLH